jgi:hypothetical protein
MAGTLPRVDVGARQRPEFTKCGIFVEPAARITLEPGRAHCISTGDHMTIGASLFLIAVGAVLKFAVTDSIKNVNLGTIGVILMVVGAAGLVLGLILMTSRRRTDVVSTPGRTTYVEPNDSADPRL